MYFYTSKYPRFTYLPFPVAFTLGALFTFVRFLLLLLLLTGYPLPLLVYLQYLTSIMGFRGLVLFNLNYFIIRFPHGISKNRWILKAVMAVVYLLMLISIFLFISKSHVYFLGLILLYNFILIGRAFIEENIFINKLL